MGDCIDSPGMLAQGLQVDRNGTTARHRGIGSQDCGGPEVPPSAVCKLEAWEGWGVIQAKSGGLGYRGPVVPGQEKMLQQRANPPFTAVLIDSHPRPLG